MQNHHSLLYREEEREMFPTLKVQSDFCTSPSVFLNTSARRSISESDLFHGLLLLEVCLRDLSSSRPSGRRQIRK